MIDPLIEPLKALPVHVLWHFHKRNNRRGFLVIDPERVTRLCKTSRCTLVMVEKMQVLDDYAERAQREFPGGKEDLPSSHSLFTIIDGEVVDVAPALREMKEYATKHGLSHLLPF